MLKPTNAQKVIIYIFIPDASIEYCGLIITVAVVKDCISIKIA